MKIKSILCVTAVVISLAVFSYLMLSSAQRVSLQVTAQPSKPMPNVLIDPGHGGEDGGAVSDDVLEKVINLSISHDTADLIKLFGFPVSMTRTTDDALTDEGDNVKARKYNDMKMRLEMYNSSKNNVILSIHQNKFSNSQSHGAQMFYSPNNPNSALLAESIRFSVFSALQPENERECKAAGKEIYLLKNTTNPAVIVECGFISNQAEREKLVTEEYQKDIALTIVTGFIDYYNTN